jgi:hypothetical protein
MQLDHRRCAFVHMLTRIRKVCWYLYSSMDAGFVDAIDDPPGVARVGVMCPRGMRRLLRHLSTLCSSRLYRLLMLLEVTNTMKRFGVLAPWREKMRFVGDVLLGDRAFRTLHPHASS